MRKQRISAPQCFGLWCFLADMRIRDSDLPAEEKWAKFFNPNRTQALRRKLQDKKCCRLWLYLWNIHHTSCSDD